MSGIRLLSIEIEGFRGFAERQLLDLDADAVVIRGDNGSGKTSLVDALLWVSCGELAHLVARVKGLRKGGDAVTSVFNPAGATVTLKLLSRGRQIVATRTGRQATTNLHVTMDGADVADPQGALADALGLSSYAQVEQAVPAWGILRQDHIRAALDLAGGELHERLSAIVGLERVSAFATACSDAARDLVRQRTSLNQAQQQIESRHEAAEVRRAAAEGATDSDSRILDTLRDGIDEIGREFGSRVTLRVGEPSLDAVAQLGQRAAAVLGALERVVLCRRAIKNIQDGTEEALAAAQAAVAAARQSTEVAEQQAPRTAQLAQLALPLLGDECPVCGQAIDSVSVHAHLEEVLAAARRFVDAADEAKGKMEDAETGLRAASEAAQRRRDAEQALETAESGLASALADAAGSVVLGEAIAADELAAAMRAVVDQLRAVYRQAQEASGAHIERLAAEAAALAAEAEKGRRTIDELERRIKAAKAIEHAAHKASKRIVERALAALAPSFAEVFDRLRPNPAFTELDVRQDIMNNKNQVVPVVRDVERGVEANPALVFSEGQLNVVALSYFLGMALNAREAKLPFVILDDPLQALDVIAILGFSDLCRRVREDRQLIVTTHDRRFADVLVRKLSPRDDKETLIVHEFEGWTREGPVVRTGRPEVANIVPLLRVS